MKNRLISVIGRKGSGKSVAATRVMANCPRIVLFDVMGEHDWCPNPVESIEELEEGLRDMHNGGGSRARFALRFLPSTFAEIEPFAEMMRRCSNITVLFEETPGWTSANSMPESFERLVLTGRHKAINMVFTGQRFSEMSRTLTAQCDAFVVFSSGEPLDLQALEARTSSEFRRAVQELPQYKALVFDVVSREYFHFDQEAALRVMKS
jgi:hypothetical protein